MTPKIDSTSACAHAAAVDSVATSVASRGAQAAAPVTQIAATDRVQLSDEGSFLSRVGAELARDAGIDLARVDAVRASLKAGTYRINPHEIATRLLRLEQELRG